MLCLEGLEEACIGYQVVQRGQTPVLVYDYETTIDVLRAGGYDDDEIQHFLKRLMSADSINPPIFVNINTEIMDSIWGGDSYQFDDDIGQHTLH